MNGLRQRVDIAGSLVNGENPAVHWWASSLGRITIRHYQLPKTGSYFYMLDHAEMLRNPRNRVTPIHEYSFMNSGYLIAVIKSEFEMDEELNLSNKSEVMSAMEFQVDNGLITPTPDDEAKLDELLRSSIGNPTISEGA